MIHAKNPVLSGFHPDPSICRVGDWFYLATSTFQWLPGVELHRSRDLVHWERLPSPLRRSVHLDLRGDPDSGGVWAPCLTHADGLFWLVYTDTKAFRGSFVDAHNYVVTAADPAGEWSDPVYLDSSGFDPSLFHDEDGRKYLVNMRWDHRAGRHPFCGIVMQEYDPAARRLVGPSRTIYTGTAALGTEGPHLFRHDGRYYLMCAEGGTAYWHGVQVARAENVWGPYESDPQPLLTAKHNPESPLQRTGHGCLVDTPNGDLFVSYLCGRPVPFGEKDRRCPLSRETALVPVEWNAEGWLRMKGVEGVVPPVEFDVDLPEVPVPGDPEKTAFDGPDLPVCFKTLRVPFSEIGSLSARPGFLRLFGRESPVSWHCQSVVARRVRDFAFEAETELEFSPETRQQLAGLMLVYDTLNYFYFHLTRDEESGQNVLRLAVARNGRTENPLPDGGAIPLGGATHVFLRVRRDVFRTWFSWSPDGRAWHDAAGELDSSNLTDEAYREIGSQGHTGTFAGMAATDLTGRRLPADFRSFSYRPL